MHGAFKKMPWVSIAAIFAILGIIGAPLFNGSISKYLISHGSNNLLLDILLIVINLGTLIAFIKFMSVFRGEGKRANTSKLRVTIIFILSGLCLIGGLLGEPAIEMLFGFSAKINMSEYTVKALIFLASLIAAYFIYYKLLAGRKALTAIREFDIGLNAIALSIAAFFVVFTGYLYLF
jgi:multicomponent Na+:H+ antiporter subunit D